MRCWCDWNIYFNVDIAGEFVAGMQPWLVKPPSDEDLERRLKEREDRRWGQD